MGKPRHKNNRDEVPGVSNNSGRGPTEDVQEAEDSVELRSISDLSPVDKIDLLNAYKAIHDYVPYPDVHAKDWILEIVKSGYQAWVNERIQELFGESKSTPGTQSQFTQAEIISLKALAQAVQQKKSPATAQPVIKPLATPPLERSPQLVNSQAYIKSQEDFLQQLAKMDRSGPEF